MGDDEVALPAMVEALSRLTRHELPSDVFEELDHKARPARWLATEAINERGLPQIDLGEWVALVERLYLERAGEGAPQGWDAPEGAAEALRSLQREGFRLALLTGIPERIARARLDRVGLGEFFPREQGAFGCEADDRDELYAIALERAGTPPQRAVHVGDTSRDVCSAVALGIRCVAVAHDGDPPRREDEAEQVVCSMPELVDALREFRASLTNGSGAAH